MSDESQENAGQEQVGQDPQGQQQASQQQEGQQSAQVQSEQQSQVKPTWPDDWRKQLAGEDAKELKQLERYASPADVWRKARALEQKLSSGDVKPTKPDNATPEQLTEWRKANGIPETPEAYDLTFEDGLVLGEDTKPRVAEFLKAAHAADMTPAQVKAAIAWNEKTMKAAQEDLYRRDEETRQRVEDEMRAEWGNDYRGNINRITAMFGNAPEGVKDAVFNARMADGTPLVSNPNVLRFLAVTARTLNPTATIVGSGGDMAKGIGEELASLKAMMGNRNSEYWKGPMAEKHQARYRELLEANERFKA